MSQTANGLVNLVLKNCVRVTGHEISGAKYTKDGIMVDGQRVRVTERMRPGQTLRVRLKDFDDPEKILPLEGGVEVLYEDEDLIIVNKPAGVAVHPSPGHYRDTLANLVAGYFAARGEQTACRIAGRLDMETSGLLVVAKNGVVQRWLQRQFEQRKVEKCYVALVEGNITDGEGFINLPLRANPLDRPRQVVDREKGREAHTRYEVLSSENGITRLALYPVTGRTHQLRVHCAHAEGLAAPIVGDRLYGHPASRLMLHCQQIRFLMPDGTTMQFSSECPF